jgi:hypothetical protein
VQAGVNLSDHPDLLQLRYDPREYWGDYQTVFGLVRALQGSAVLVFRVIQRIHKTHRDMRYWVMAWGMGAMAQYAWF